MEVLRRCPLAIAQRLVHCAIAVSTAVLDRVTKTMSVAPLLTNNLDNLKQNTSSLLSQAPPPYSWSLLGKVEGPAPPPSSKISWSFDLAWNPASVILHEWIAFYSHRSDVLTALAWLVPRETATVSAQVLCTPYKHAPCHFMQSHKGKVFSCNLPPALLADWPGSFTCYCGNTGVERIPK